MMQYPELALNIVTNLLKIHSNDIVSISGEIYNCENSKNPLIEIPFIEELALTIRKLGAFPVLEISTENLKKRFFSEMPDKIFSVPPNYYKNWIDTIDYFLEVSWKNYTGSLETITRAQATKFENSAKSVIKHLHKQKKKIIYFNLPTQELADKAGLEYNELQKIYSKSVNCNYDYLRNIGSNILDEYSSYANYQIFSENEKLNLKINRSKIKLFSGDFKRQHIISLPTGYVEIPIFREELNGIYLADKIYYQDNIFCNVKMKFENGSIRYLVFKNDNKGNVKLQNELLNSLNNCYLTIGFNDNFQASNHIYYDRCLEDNISLIFLDRNSSPIYASNQNSSIKKRI